MKITIPQGSLKIEPVAVAWTEPVVLAAGGRAPAIGWLQALANSYPVWAVDRGADVCRAAAVIPEIFIGDADSSDAASWKWLAALQVPSLRYPTDKDDSDLQLALQELARQRPGATALLTGGWGGRFDHAWSNVASLIQAVQWGLGPAALVDQAEAMFLLSGGQQLTFDFVQLPKIISLIPLTTDCEQVVSDGVHWPLSGVNLSMHEPAAISNRLAENSQGIRVGLQAGILGVYCCWQETGL
jgi:thiamine pyrophosphokinase